MKLLVVIDYQNDFVVGPLGFPRACELEDKIINIKDEYDNICFLNTVHDKSYLDSNDGKILPIEHCMINTSGASIYGKVNELKPLLVINKESFGSLELAEYIKNNNIDEVGLCGLNSHSSIFINALLIKTVTPNIKLRVIKNCVDSFDKVLEDKAYQILTGLFVEVR